MHRLFTLSLIAVALNAVPEVVHAQAAASRTLVTTAWLQEHLTDPKVRVVATGRRSIYDAGHIPGASFVEHDDTLDMTASRHQIKSPAALAAVLEKAGVVDGVRLVLYGDTPMTTGWLYTVIASVGHGADVSMLDGNIELWRAEGRPISTAAAPAPTGRLTVSPAGVHAVDAAWVRGHLKAPDVALLDVRTTREWDAGRLPGATFILWQDLFVDLKTLKWKSPDELRALFAKAGVKPGQQVVTYCAVGMRASLMAWAASSVGLPAQVYVGSWQDWSQDAANPVVK